MRVSELRNLGAASERMLAAVGITTAEELRAVGAVEAYLRVEEAGVPGASLNLLWGLYAAIEDIDWRDIPEDVRAGLRAAVR